MDINKLALEYLKEPIVVEAATKRKTRRALATAYDRIRDKYIEQSEIVDQIKTEGAALQKKYEKHNSTKKKLYEQMVDLRNKLNTMDDSAKKYIELEIEEPVDASEDELVTPEEEPTSDELPDPAPESEELNKQYLEDERIKYNISTRDNY